MAAIPGPVQSTTWVDDVTFNGVQNPIIRTAARQKFQGQTGNTVAGNVANQAVGTVALPAIASATRTASALTISNSLITTSSIVEILAIRYGTTTPAAGAIASLKAQFQAPGTGSIVLDLANEGSAATLATDYALQYQVLN